MYFLHFLIDVTSFYDIYFYNNIPKELSEHEYKLNYEVFNLQTQFQQEIDNDSIQRAFADKKEEFQIFIDSLKRMYPEYVKIKEEVEIVSLAQTIKNYKKENAAFVEYILHDKQGYGIYYEGKGSIIFKISNKITKIRINIIIFCIL